MTTYIKYIHHLAYSVEKRYKSYKYDSKHEAKWKAKGRWERR